MTKNKLYLLPTEEELYLQENFSNSHDQHKTYRFGWMKGRVYSCNQILKYVELNKLDKSQYKPLLEFILGQKLSKSTDIHQPPTTNKL